MGHLAKTGPDYWSTSPQHRILWHLGSVHGGIYPAGSLFEMPLQLGHDQSAGSSSLADGLCIFFGLEELVKDRRHLYNVASGTCANFATMGEAKLPD